MKQEVQPKEPVDKMGKLLKVYKEFYHTFGVAWKRF